MSLKRIWILLAVSFFIASSMTAQESIEIFVWNDLNGNAIQEGEPGIDGIENSLVLFEDVNANGIADPPEALGNPVDMGGGTYSWSLAATANNYIIAYDGSLAPNWYPVPGVAADPNGSDATDDSDLDATNLQSQFFTIPVGSNTTVTNIDFAFVAPASIGDFVWEDTNGNGIQDGTEAGFDWAANGITINISNSDGSVVTDLLGISPPVVNNLGAGGYSFTNLPPGEYVVNFSQQAGVVYRTIALAGAPAVDSDPDMTTGDTNPIAIISGSIQEEIDAGYVLPASIGDFVWVDNNGNGIQDGGELGLDGVTVSITDDTGAAVSDLDGNPVIDEITAGGGMYMFDMLSPGNYIITFSDHSAFNFYRTIINATGGPDDASDTADDSDADQTSGATHIIELSSNEMLQDIDAGYHEPASVEGLVFHDSDGNGLYDGGAIDSPLENFVVDIVDDMGNPVNDVNGNPVASQLSDAAGMVLFDNLPPGNYRLVFTPMASYEFTFQDVSGFATDTDDVADDSDVQAMATSPQLSHVFELLGGEMENRVSAGLFRRLSIGNQLWIESDDNGMYDPPGDNGAAGATIRLMYDMDFDGVPENPLAFTISDAGGNYSFNNLVPGYYQVLVEGSNFGPGGSLESFQSCTPFADVNDGVDDDDNGDGDALALQDVGTNILELFCLPDNPDVNTTVDFCFFFDCDNNSVETYTDCASAEEAGPICNLQVLDNFCGTMFTETSGGDQPNPLCPGEGGAHNISWFSFVAGGTGFSIEIIPLNCTTEQGTQGMQAGLYTDCTFSTAVVCEPNPSTEPFIISGGLVPGETYYFFMDGSFGSVCDFEVNLIDGDSAFDIPEPTGLICDVPDCGPVCPGSEITFTVEGLDLDIEYNWSIPPGATLVGPGEQSGNDVVTMTNQLTLSFADEGNYSVSMVFASNGCDNTVTPVTADVVVANLPNEDFGAIEVCEHDFPYDLDPALDPNADGVGWQGGSISGPGEDITFTYTNPEGCTYDQIVDIIQIDNLPAEDVLMYLCPEDLPYSYDDGALIITDNSFANGQEYTLVNMQNTLGCDSTVNLSAILFNLEGDLDQESCQDNSIDIMFTQTDIFPLLAQIDYVWVDFDGNVVTDGDNVDNVLTVTESGSYTLQATVVEDGHMCTFVFGSIFVDIESQVPLPPDDVNWQLSPCVAENTPIQYEVEDDSGVTLFNWTITGDGVILGSESDAVVSVQWGPGGGELCVAGVNICGVGTNFCADVTPTAAPEIGINISSTACQDSVVSISHTGTLNPTATFSWDFGNGQTSTTAGPHDITYDTPGKYYITVSASDNGCETNEALDSITILEALPAPNLTCTSTTDAITFVWNSVTNANGYDITVLSGASGTIVDDTTYVVTGLAEGDGSEISVVALGDAPCVFGDAAIAQCFAQNCDEPTITLMATQDSICLTSSVSNQTITATIDPAGGTGVFSGTGIVDANAGIFDPNMAGVGQHVIQYQWIGDDGCMFSRQITMEVFEQPEASFSMSNDTICISDVLTLAYDGATSGVTANWDFGPNVITPGSGTGPFDVSFNAPGLQSITLEVSKGQCISEMLTKQVLVQDTLPTLVIDCNSDATNINFSWNDIADTYEVIIDNVSQGTITDNNWSIPNVSPGTIANIEVIAISNNICPSVSAERQCQASDCPDLEVVLTDQSQTICLDGSDQSINLSYTVIGGFMDGSGVAMWSGAGVDPLTGVFNPVNAGEGSHLITLNYAEGECAAPVQMLTITVVSSLSAEFTGFETICEGSQLTLTHTGSASASATYNWTTSGATVVGADNEASITLQFDAAGDYNIALVVMDGDCESDPFSQTITVDNNLLPPAIFCANPSSQAINFEWGSVVGAVEYEVIIDGVSQGTQTNTSWSDNTVAPGDSLTIEVIAISGNTCANSSSMDVCYAIDCPATDVIPSIIDTTICANDLIDFNIDFDISGGFGDGTGEGMFTGNGVNPITGMVTAADLQVGDNVIYIDYSENGCDTRDSVIVRVLDLPNIAIEGSAEVICITDTLTVNYVGESTSAGSYSLNVTGSPMVLDALPGMDQYQWSMPGTYTITPTYTQGECTVIGDPISVEVQPELELPEIMCSPDLNNINLSWKVIDCASTYNVFVDGVLVSNQTETNFVVENLDDGQSVDIQVEAVSDCQCQNSSATINCSATPCPEFDLTFDTEVEDCISNLNSNIQLGVTVTGGAGNGSTVWSGNHVSSDGIFDVSSSGIGTFEVMYNYSEGNCMLDSMFTITVFDDPVISLSQTPTPCFSSIMGEIQFDASGGDGNYTYTIEGDLPELPMTINEAGSLALSSGIAYTVTVMDGNGCSSQDVISISVPTEPDFSVEGPSVIPLGENGDFSINFGSVNQDEITNITWYDDQGNIVCQGTECLTVNVEPSTTSTYCVDIELLGECTTTSCIEVVSEFIPNFNVSNVFSPNNDGTNDRMVIQSNNPEAVALYLRIYDRWGNLVFSVEDPWRPYDDMFYPGWDGTYKGKDLNPGVFVYVLEYVESIEDTPKLIFGDITILR